MADLTPAAAADARRSLEAQLAALRRYHELLLAAGECSQIEDPAALERCLAEGDAVVAALAREALVLSAVRIALADPACQGPEADAARDLCRRVAEAGDEAHAQARQLATSLREKQQTLAAKLAAVGRELDQRRGYTAGRTEPPPLLIDTTG